MKHPSNAKKPTRRRRDAKRLGRRLVAHVLLELGFEAPYYWTRGPAQSLRLSPVDLVDEDELMVAVRKCGVSRTVAAKAIRKSRKAVLSRT